MDSELQASPDASTPSIQPAELPPHPKGSPSVAAAGAIGALLGALLVVAFGDAVWSGKADASKLSLDIEAATPTQAEKGEVLSALGVVALDPEHVATVTIPGHGIVRHVASFEGDRVHRGAVLAVIQSARTNRNPTERYELVSPIEGTVVERSLHPSDDVQAEVLAFRVADLDHLRVDLHLKRREAESIQMGDRVELSPLSAHELSVDGNVAALAPAPGGETIVSVRVLDRHHHLREGDGVRARLFSGAKGATASLL